MKLACQDNLVPGASYREKLDNLGRYGYEGMELQGAGLLDRMDEALAAFRGHSVRCSTICAGFRGALLAASPADRRLAVNDIKALLEAAARLEAVGLIAVPIFGRDPQISDLSPWKSAVELEWELLTVLWADLAEHARRLGTLLLIEPLMRYQTHLINRLEQGAELLRRVPNPGTAMMADFFHMNVEEADVNAALRAQMPYIAHIHLSDSNRKLAGLGHVDFAGGFRVLREAGYTGYMAQEAVLDPGDVGAALALSARWVREQW